jgi:hypothetical protein
MKWPILTCPFCRGRLPNEEVWPGKPLVCPRCSEQLQPETRQLHLSGLIALGITVTACYLFGLRGLWLVGATIVFWFPIGVLWEFIFARIVPPRFEKYTGPEEKPIRLHLND